MLAFSADTYKYNIKSRKLYLTDHTQQYIYKFSFLFRNSHIFMKYLGQKHINPYHKIFIKKFIRAFTMA